MSGVRILFLAFCFLLSAIVAPVRGRPAPIRAYAVIDRDQMELHKYAAILAASQPQRIIRDQEIKSILNPFSYFLWKLEGGAFNNPKSRLRLLNAEVDAVCEDYERRLLDVVETYGMNAETFNEISNDLVHKQSLRKRVLLQAFYYKLAADLQGNIAGSRKPLGKKANTEKNNRHVDVEIKVDRRADKCNKAKEPNHLFKFVRALKEVEADRLRVRTELLVSKIYV